MMVRAADVMTRDVLTIPESLSVGEAAWTLMHRGVTGAPVHDVSGRLVGVVSQTDLVETQAWLEPDSNHDEGVLCVGDVMTPALLAVAETDPIQRALEVMTSHHVHRVLVLDDDGHLRGIVTSTDLLRLVADGKLSLLDSPTAELSFGRATDEEGSHA
jgi:CBS domain-containing protein